MLNSRSINLTIPLFFCSDKLKAPIFFCIYIKTVKASVKGQNADLSRKEKKKNAGHDQNYLFVYLRGEIKLAMFKL